MNDEEKTCGCLCLSNTAGALVALICFDLKGFVLMFLVLMIVRTVLATFDK